MEDAWDKSDIDLQSKRLSLIDFTSENDALVINTSSPLTSTGAGLDHRQLTETEMHPELFESLEGPLSIGKDAGLAPDSEDDQFPHLKESLEPDSYRRKGKCNLRKSLAWDSAFFTSAGVLDADELSCMMKGAEKSDRKLLPGIEEDLQRSTDSISTLESDNLVIENLEAELFEDIRASIQKSSKGFISTSETCKATSGESKGISSKKKMSMSSQNQKHQPALKKPIGISKAQTKQTLRPQGTAKVVTRDAGHPQVAEVKSIVRPGNSNTTLKPPRVTSNLKPTTTLAKRASFAASDVNKMGPVKVTTVAGKVPQGSKGHIVSGARRVLPKSTLSSRAASLDSSNSTKSAISSLTDSSGSVSTEKASRSHAEPVQRKVGIKTAMAPSAASTLKTPSKTALRNKTTSGNSAVSAYLMSSKISSSISPASSISEWSSASSSCSTTTNVRSQSRTSFDTSSCRSSQNDLITSDCNDHHNSQMLDGDEIEGLTACSKSGKKSSIQTGIPCSDSARPSGLRLPSPKIGFFDGGKSIRTPNGSLQSHAGQTMLPKTGAAVSSPSSMSSNMKPKIGKLSQVRAISASSKKNPPERTSLMSSSEKLQTPFNDNSGESNIEGLPISSVDKHEMDGESCLKAEEVGGGVPDQANHVESAGIGVVTNENELSFTFKSERTTTPHMDSTVSLKGNKVVAAGAACEPISREILKPLEEVDKDGQEIIASILPSFLGADEKENVAFREQE